MYFINIFNAVLPLGSGSNKINVISGSKKNKNIFILKWVDNIWSKYPNPKLIPIAIISRIPKPLNISLLVFQSHTLTSLLPIS